MLLLAVPGQQWRTGRCSRTLACSAESKAWHLSFDPGYSCNAREGQQGKSYCWSHRAQTWSFRSPTLIPFLSYFETSREVRGSWGFSFPFFLWYTSFAPASKDNTAVGIVGCWFLSAQRHFHICDMAQVLALPPLAFQRGQGAAAQLKICMQCTHFAAKSWAGGKHLAEEWFSHKRAQTLLCLGQPLLGKLSIINKFLVDNYLHPESKHYCFFP